MPKVNLMTVLKLLVLSLVVGMLLNLFDLSPIQLLRRAYDHFDALLAWTVQVFGTAASYILIGAVVVVPIWGVIYLLNWLKQR